MFYKEMQEESRGAFLEYHSEAQILKIYLLSANQGDTFEGLICVLVCPQKLWVYYWPCLLHAHVLTF